MSVKVIANPLNKLEPPITPPPHSHPTNLNQSPPSSPQPPPRDLRLDECASTTHTCLPQGAVEQNHIGSHTCDASTPNRPDKGDFVDVNVDKIHPLVDREDPATCINDRCIDGRERGHPECTDQIPPHNTEVAAARYDESGVG